MYSSKLNFMLQSIGVILLISCAAAKLPNYLKRCVAGDAKCIIENLNILFGEKYRGDESFGLTQVEPLKMEDLIIRQDPANSVAINLALQNPVVYGIKKIKVRKVKGFGKTPDGRHELLLHAPYLTGISDYEIDGKVLILPIKGKGKSNITLVEPLMKIIIDASSHIEDGKTYLNIKDLHVECKPKRMTIHFENLFNGDKALGENINAFLNENWKEIYEELKRPWYDAIAKQTKESATKIFNTTPYDEIFEIS